MKYLLCLVLIICFSCTKKDIVVKGNFKEKEKREIRTINLENTDQSEVYILNSDSTYTFLNSKDLSYNFGKVIATNDSTAFISVPIEKFNFLKSIHTIESKSEDIELYFYDKTGDLIPFLNIEVYRDNYKTDLLALNGLLKLNSFPDSISIPKLEYLSGLKHNFSLSKNGKSYEVYLDLNHEILEKFMNYNSPNNKHFVVFTPLEELLK